MAMNLDDYMLYGPMTLNPYDDGFCMSISIECDIDSMAKNLAREIDEAALPRTLEILETQYGYVKAERLQVVEAENAKLRERIKELESCIRGDAEGIYRLAKNTGYLHTDELMESIHNRMRELGVEVSDGRVR